jgi:hypothetical protein
VSAELGTFPVLVDLSQDQLDELAEVATRATLELVARFLVNVSAS